MIAETDSLLDRIRADLETAVDRAKQPGQERKIQHLETELEKLADRLARLESDGRGSEQVRPRLAELGQKTTELGQRQMEFDQRQTKLGQQIGQIAAVKAQWQECRRGLGQLKPMKLELDLLRRRMAGLRPGQLDLPSFYADFEKRFRGEQQMVRERQQYYLQFIDEAGAGTPEARVLDLGCGRGEWLTLLREHNKFAHGVDLNDPFLDLCRGRGLEVTKADALEYLTTCEPASLGAVTGFHIIEHMVAFEQIRLVQLAFRALRPGGVLILETPNLENLQVAAHDFYLDPTHVRPVPAKLLDFTARQVGFGDVRTEGRAPCEDGDAAQGWSRYQDLALIAFRSAAEAEEGKAAAGAE
jgi:O-antigen chain-terminating methyltransferase